MLQEQVTGCLMETEYGNRQLQNRMGPLKLIGARLQRRRSTELAASVTPSV